MFGVMLPRMNGANTPATPASAKADAEGDGGDEVDVDAGGQRLVRG